MGVVKRTGMFVSNVKWREIPFSSKFEMSSNGDIRDAKTRKPRAAKGPLGYVDVDGKRKLMPIWRVYELIWPEKN